MDLSGKKVVVTGAAGALGVVVSVAIRSTGAEVACILSGSTKKAPAELKDCLLVGDTDLTDAAAARRALEKASSDFGGLDGLVNIAGGFQWEKVKGGDIATWERMFSINLRTTVNATQAALPVLKASGARIVNIGAAGAMKAAAGMGAYAASKAGVAKLTEALAEELKDSGTTVNAILPGIIDTAANRASMPDAQFDRWVRPQQIAELAIFLLSERASAITGALIPITGRV